MIRFGRSLVVVFLIALAGCSDKSQTAAPQPAVAEERPDTSIATAFEKPVDFAAAKDILQRYSSRWSDAKRTGLTAAAKAQAESLGKWFPTLNRNDAIFVASLDFDPADAVYLEESLFLRDVEKSLRLRSLPPAEKAKFAFEWIARQIYLKNRPGLPVLAVPAPIGLLSGCGLPWDRSFAFLALLRQIDLDGYLIGPPEAATIPFVSQLPSNPNLNFAPFWGLGVRIDKAILLFDPQTGNQIVRKDGKPAAWSDLKTDDELAGRIAGTKRTTAVTAGQVRASVPVLAVPLPALTARMKLLHDELKGDGRLYVDLDRSTRDLRECGAEARFWYLPGDAAGFVHLHQLYATNPGLTAEMRRQVVPMEAFPRVFQNLQGQQAMASLMAYYSKAFLKLHFPLEDADSDPPALGLYSGSLAETIRKFLKLVDESEAERQAIQKDPNLERDVLQWCELANSAFAAVSRAQRGGDPIALSNAQASLDQVVKGASQPMKLIGKTILTLTAKESLYYVAMTVHEKADRLRFRALAEPGRVKVESLQDAWRDAADWWSRYLNYTVGAVELRNAAREQHARGQLEAAKAQSAAK